MGFFKSLKDWWDDDSSFLPKKNENNSNEPAGFQNKNFKENQNGQQDSNPFFSKDNRKQEIAFNKRQQLKQQVIQENVNGELNTRQAIDSIYQNDFEQAQQLNNQREQIHLQQMNEIRQMSQGIHQRQNQTNAEIMIKKNREKLAKQLELEETQRKAELNHEITERTFNFWKVKEFLNQGLTLQSALVAAGAQKNVEYDLDYQGRSFVWLMDDTLDNACISIKQNMALINAIQTEQAAIVATGWNKRASFSIGSLIYDPGFGFILIKNDRYSNTYVNHEADILMDSNKINDQLGFDTIALSKTFMKNAVTSAVCINTGRGIETQEDMDLLNQLKQYSPQDFIRFKEILSVFDLYHGN